MDKEKAVNQVVNRFDFVKVWAVMRFLDWRWTGDVPTKEHLISQARALLESVLDMENGGSSECGGFRARYTPKTEEGEELRLCFIVQQSCCCEDWVN